MPIKKKPDLLREEEFLSPMAVSVNEAAKIAGASRTALYEALQRKELSAKKNGRRTLILREELKRYLENLPDYGGASGLEG